MESIFVNGIPDGFNIPVSEFLIRFYIVALAPLVPGLKK
jgi:hypothetical protein